MSAFLIPILKGGEELQRFDTVEIRAIKTDEGFIRDAPVIGRAGILRYKNPDGSDRIEYRPPDEAFAADSLASIAGKPITVGHKGMVTADNAGQIQPVGSVLSAGRQDGNAIRADIMIYCLPTSARELSCGYSLDLDETPGTTPEGEHYDAIQRNIRYNHVAVVARGRAGIARLNMDGEQVIEEDEIMEKMSKVRLDSGLEYDAAPEVGVYVEKLRQDNAAVTKERDQLQAKYDATLADAEKVKKEHEDAASKAKETFAAAVKARVAMLDAAKAHHIDKADGMTDKEIKIAVIKAVRGDSIALDGKSDDYIDAAYDMACAEKREDGLADQREKLGKPARKDEPSRKDEVDDPEAALAKLRADEAALWAKEVK